MENTISILYYHRCSFSSALSFYPVMEGRLGQILVHALIIGLRGGYYQLYHPQWLGENLFLSMDATFRVLSVGDFLDVRLCRILITQMGTVDGFLTLQ
jgi:hypothetical protein